MNQKEIDKIYNDFIKEEKRESFLAKLHFILNVIINISIIFLLLITITLVVIKVYGNYYQIDIGTIYPMPEIELKENIEPEQFIKST